VARQIIVTPPLRGVRAQVIAKGWVPEGIGPDAVQMCAPQ